MWPVVRILWAEAWILDLLPDPMTRMVKASNPARPSGSGLAIAVTVSLGVFMGGLGLEVRV